VAALEERLRREGIDPGLRRRLEAILAQEAYFRRGIRLPVTGPGGKRTPWEPTPEDRRSRAILDFLATAATPMGRAAWLWAAVLALALAGGFLTPANRSGAGPADP
jgi:hypothetical protein